MKKSFYGILILFMNLIAIGILVYYSNQNVSYNGGIWTENGFKTFRTERAIYLGDNKFQTLSDGNIWIVEGNYKVNKKYKLEMHDNCTSDYLKDDVIIKIR